MKDQITKSLNILFERYGNRIVLWKDVIGEFDAVFDELQIESVEKIRIENNEFGVKHHILREKPKQKFLLYRSGTAPTDSSNWLLDVELAHTDFIADSVVIWRTELGLRPQIQHVIEEHKEFFKSAPRRLEKLKARVDGDASQDALRTAMMAICVDCSGGFDNVVEALVIGEASREEEATESSQWRLIERCNLSSHFWKRVGVLYGYQSEKPSIADFAITLFGSALTATIGHEAIQLGGDWLLLFRRLKDSRSASEAFKSLSDRYANVLEVERKLKKLELRKYQEVDFFEIADRICLSVLVDEIAKRTITSSAVADLIKERKRSLWFSKYEDLYEACRHASEFLQTLHSVNISISDLADGVKRYTGSWSGVDRSYRKFIYHTQRYGQTNLLHGLSEQIENGYANQFLLRLSEAWQTQVDAAPKWIASQIPHQRNFYNRYVDSFRQKGQKIIVIISDALRYEIGDELAGRIRSLDRFSAQIEPMLGCLPSYTQLGMAALLPNKTLAISDDNSGTVLVNGQSSSGSDNRAKILASTNDRTRVMKSEDLAILKTDDLRGVLKDHDIIYVYHDVIDRAGDNMKSEGTVFETAENAMVEIVKMVQKFMSANANNVIVTADHGFLYQHRPIEESDYSNATVAGDVVLYRNRRFVLGKGLKVDHGLRHFTPSEANLEGDVEILIPKSITRLRQQGSGSRFVHGGATLQEVVVPVLQITKRRTSDTSLVEVDIVHSGNGMITTNQYGAVFFQTAAVDEKTQARRLRAGLHAADETLISDQQELTFDITSSNPRDREMRKTFLLSRQADAYNGQDVFLVLEEQHGDTTHYTKYKQARFTLKLGMGRDFDF
ncbi:BREX-1 system phosphatase PglZ type A [Siculibacillus lacustris]|uniref:BREX-1 system phosphatase PglZ type A n=1 Tax=Siculibacillus lacustris TaxID=1549641 RepID=A0A4Q9VCS3_9HYPH|nr:BREX-1 system phosphatase PglZ type A [Siculibacillus lacustris]TBW32407.1 BREX-1 system phosphatase PglZ type A [Siculibacillus lacustris]